MTTSTPMSRPCGVTPEDFPGSMLTDGRIAWLPGFLGVLGVAAILGAPPLLGYVAMSVAWVILGLLQRANPVARRTGRRAAIVGGAHLLLLLALVVTHRVLAGAPFATFETFDTVLIFPITVYVVFVAPVVAIVLAVAALLVPVSRTRATRVLARDAARHGDQPPQRPSDPPR